VTFGVRRASFGERSGRSTTNANDESRTPNDERKTTNG